ncbi:MAG: N-carbamoylputrescine amidase [Kiloniellales bacterium]
MAKVTVAATQMACSWDRESNVRRVEKLVREAAKKGAQIVLPQELFETPYFCKDQKQEHFALAHPVEDNALLKRMAALAAELEIVLPVSFFERANNAYYNSLAMIDADGKLLGVYRKSHIPQGPGYEEKFYFNPGDSGFKVFKTRYAAVGAAICWDQWFPECARALALKGADLLFYPTAIGSEPQDSSIDSRDHWQRTMQGHAAANMVPLVTSNRVGSEEGDGFSMTFYGSSFISDQTGAKIAEADRTEETVLIASFDLKRNRAQRASWGLFRDRRPDLYGALATADGVGG